MTTAQLFTFTGNSTTIPLLPANQADTCLFDNNGNLDDTSCDTTNPEADQVRLFHDFTNVLSLTNCHL